MPLSAKNHILNQIDGQPQGLSLRLCVIIGLRFFVLQKDCKGSNPINNSQKIKGTANAIPFIYDGEQGIFRRTAVRLRIASLFNHGLSNSPPDCFHRQSRPSLFESLAVLSTKNNGTVFTTPYRYSLAESKGFEPSKPFWRFTRFPIVLLRPARTTLRVTCDIIYDCLKKIKCELQ